MSKTAALKALIREAFPLESKRIEGISPVPLPRNSKFPWITIQMIIGRELETHDGPSGFDQTVFQINCWDRDLEEADKLRTELKDLLLDYEGPAGDLTIDGTNHDMDTEIYDGVIEAHNALTRLHIAWV